MTERKYVVFRLAGESYGVPIERVERILPAQAVTRLPKTPPALLGVFELRGRSIPAFDLRLRLDLPAATDEGTMVVAQTSAGRCAFLVDHVEGIYAFDESQVDYEGTALAKDDPFAAGIARHGGRLVLLLNPDEVVPEELRAQVASVDVGPLLAA